MNANLWPAGNTDSTRDIAGHVLPQGSPRLEGEALEFVSCTDSTLRVFDDRVEVIARVIKRQSMGILFNDLAQIIYTAPVGRALGSIHLHRSVDMGCEECPATVWLSDGSSADKCINHVRAIAPQIEITRSRKPDRTEGLGLKAKLEAKEKEIRVETFEAKEKVLRASKREAERKQDQIDRELRKRISGESREARRASGMFSVLRC